VWGEGVKRKAKEFPVVLRDGANEAGKRKLDVPVIWGGRGESKKTGKTIDLLASGTGKRVSHQKMKKEKDTKITKSQEGKGKGAQREGKT